MRRKSNLESVALAVTILVCSTALHGAEGPWLPVGLQGNNIWALEVSPSGWILAGTAEQNPKTMYRSVDFGLSWTEVEGLPPETEIWDIEIDPTDESIVYAGLNGGGVWKSIDGGVRWSWAYLDGQIWDVEVSPTNPSILYVASQTGGVYKSTDAGVSWASLTSEVVTNATAVVVHPTNPDIALAGTPFDGVFKTADGGATWLQVNAGFGFTPDIRSLFIDPHTPTTVYAGEFSNGVFKSLDGGLTWFRPAPTLHAGVKAIKALDNDLYIIDLFEANNIPAYRSQDGGVTWEPLPRLPDLPGQLWPKSLEVVPGAVLIGTGLNPNPGGIYIWELPVTVESVLTWIDSAVAQGDLEGTGGGASGDRRLSALINMVELTADLIDTGMIAEACDQLLVVLRKTDGNSRPPDFVEGPATEDLSQSIQELRDNLGCG